MWLPRIVFVTMLTAIFGGAVYMSSQGVWGASAGVTSVRAGTYGVAGRVK